MHGSYDSAIRKDELVHGFREVGLKAGHHLVVHSSLSSFGHVEGGANTVIDALEEVITSEGTLVMPTFSGELIYSLEALALRRGINGPDATGHGVVFEGSKKELWRELKDIFEEAVIRYPFNSPKTLWNQLLGERPRVLGRRGWNIELEGSKFMGSETIRITRDASPLPVEEVRPWRMPVWTGIIPNTFWQRPETIRSHQYSGSFTAWGKFAERVLKGHNNQSGGKLQDHPLYRMKEAGGKILLLGINHGSNSTIHVAEWIAVRDCGVKLPDPESWKEFVGDFQNVDDPLDRKGGQIKGKIGNAEVRLADTRALFEVVNEILKQKLQQRFGSASP